MPVILIIVKLCVEINVAGAETARSFIMLAFSQLSFSVVFYLIRNPGKTN